MDSDSTIHRVRQGETLAGIAAWWGCSVEELARTNGVQLTVRVWPGQVVRLPPSASVPSEFPGEPPEPRVDVEHLSTSAKVSKALELSWRSWPAQVAGVAKESFSDPAFILTLLVVMGIYAGLWLTPDPTMITKVLAGTLTVVLLTQFAWEDIYGLAQAWFVLREQCERARTREQLQAAGDIFARKVGHVGFDLLLFLVMWRVGKRVEPRLTEVGVKRALAQAEARVAKAEAQPGSNIVRPAQGEALKVLEAARRRANSTDPSRVLDALNASLPEAARRGLASLRGQKGGDAGALVLLEKILLVGGKDLTSFLPHQGVPKAQSDIANASWLEARALLARAQMLRMKALRDPILRRAMSEELSQYLWRILELLESPPDWKRVREAIRARDIAGLVGELGESIQRSLLARKYPATEGYRVFANVEHVRLVEGFSRIVDWQGGEKAAGRSGEPKGLYEWQGRLWKSITEVDALIARKDGSGRWRLVELEQMKTGKHDQPIRAHEQNVKALEALKEIASGKETVRLATRVGKHTLGADLTGEFDLSSLQEGRIATRGVEKKGFDRDIPFVREVLHKVAQSLVEKGLPPDATTVPPLSGVVPRRKEAGE